MNEQNIKRVYTVELQELSDGRFKFASSHTTKRINQFQCRVVKVPARGLARKVNNSELVIK
jgi:hypothetical protein